MQIFQKFSTALLFASLISLASPQAHAVVSLPSNYTAFTFNGNCIDCAEAAGQSSYMITGELILKDYGYSIKIDPSNFVSFSYGGSNLFASYTINLDEIISTTSGEGVGGMLHSPDSFGFSVHAANGLYFSGSEYEWETGRTSNADFGNSASFTSTNSVPEPTSLLLLGVALIGAGLARRRSTL